MTRVRFNPWLAAPLLVLLTLWATIAYRTAVPTRADWDAAATHVRTQLAAGDGVTWAPEWATEVRLSLHGLPVFLLDDVEGVDFARYDRVWLLSAFGVEGDDVVDRMPSVTHEVISTHQFGAVTVSELRVAGETVVGDVYAQLESVAVSLDAKNARRPCDFWDGRGWHCKLRGTPDETRACLAESTATKLAKHRRFNRRRRAPRKGGGLAGGDPRCGLDRWLNVSRDVRVIGDAPRQCVWFHPQGGKTLRLEWAAAPSGDVVEIAHGFTDKMITDHTRKETRTRPATLRVYRGERLLGTQTLDPVKGWRSWRLEDGGTGPLRIEAETASTVDAHLCIDATVRRAR